MSRPVREAFFICDRRLTPGALEGETSPAAVQAFPRSPHDSGWAEVRHFGFLLIRCNFKSLRSGQLAVIEEMKRGNCEQTVIGLIH